MGRHSGDWYYYLNGKFYDRMSNRPSYVARVLKAKIVKRKKRKSGEMEIYLKSK